MNLAHYLHQNAIYIYIYNFPKRIGNDNFCGLFLDLCDMYISYCINEELFVSVRIKVFLSFQVKNNLIEFRLFMLYFEEIYEW